MGRIIDGLNKLGHKVIKTDDIYRGYQSTEHGDRVYTLMSHKYYYDLKVADVDEAIYFLSINGERTIPCNDLRLYIVNGTEYEDRKQNLKEIEQLADEGKILSFTGDELYAEYYDFKHNKKLECAYKYGCSAACREYIESVMEETGIEKYTEEYIDTGYKHSKEAVEKVHWYDIKAESDVYIRKGQDGKWFAEMPRWIDEEMLFVTFVFNHKPSIEDLKIAFVVREFHQCPKEIFACHKCGENHNILELNGNLFERYEMVWEPYCGC